MKRKKISDFSSSNAGTLNFGFDFRRQKSHKIALSGNFIFLGKRKARKIVDKKSTQTFFTHSKNVVFFSRFVMSFSKGRAFFTLTKKIKQIFATFGSRSHYLLGVCFFLFFNFKISFLGRFERVKI